MDADSIAVLTLVAVCWVLTLVWAWAHGRAEGYWMGEAAAARRQREAIEHECDRGAQLRDSLTEGT